MTRLALGTVQFGLDYGISNAMGRTAPGEVAQILALAREAGIDTLDTAAAYGAAEATIGELGTEDFRIVTKTPHLEGTAHERAATVNSSFERSLDLLRRPHVDALLVHRAEDLLDSESGDSLWEVLVGLRESGRVGKIGVSVYDRAQIDALLERYPIEIVQLPLGIFAQSLWRDGTIGRLRDRCVEIHARSLFLQGLVFVDPSSLAPWFEPALGKLRAFREAVVDRNGTPLQAALSFAQAVEEVDRFVVGVESRAQLQEILDAWNSPLDLDFADFDLEDERFTNPRNWVLN